jgi:polysaccharide biosynthesis PFTS motif protein
MRGYRILQQQNKTDYIHLLKHQISNTHLNVPHQEISKTIFGAGVLKAELILRQYLMVKIIGLKFNETILCSVTKPNEKIAYPLPNQWIKILQQNGIKVSEIKSHFLFFTLCLKMIFIGIGYGLYLSINSLLKLRDEKVSNQKNGIVYFDSLSASCISNKPNDNNIISWYLQYKNRLKNVEFIFHSVKNMDNVLVDNVNVNFYSKAIVLFGSIKSIIYYLGWIIKSTIIALFNLLCGKWWNVIIYHEASKAASVKMQKPQFLANQYLFHNSNWLYRPLWTYEAEIKGSEIIFYFYSTNCESFVQKGKKFIQANNWQLINWPKYLVWDKYQSDFIKRFDMNSPVIDIVGPIWFSSSQYLGIDILSKNTIAVFDVQPMRDSFYQTLGSDFNYYVPRTSNSFINDIYEATRNSDFQLFFKRKRDIGKYAHSSYLQNLEKFKSQTNFIFIDPNVDASKIIENCFAVISMPFTSTAIIGKLKGKPSVYYDPHGRVIKNDPAAHGIEVLIGKEELCTWLFRVFKDNHE